MASTDTAPKALFEVSGATVAYWSARDIIPDTGSWVNVPDGVSHTVSVPKASLASGACGMVGANHTKNGCECKRKVSVLSRRVWVYFVMCISKQPPVIGPNSALVLYVLHFLLMTAVYSNSQRGAVNSGGIW